MKLRLGPLGAPVAIVMAWVAMRVTMLLPVPDEIRVADRRAVPVRSASAAPVATGTLAELAAPQVTQIHPFVGQTAVASRHERPLSSSALHDVAFAAPVPDDVPSRDALLSPPAFRGRSGIVSGYAAPRTYRAHPISGSAWALINGTGGAVGVPSLGGSQAGVRVYLQGEGAPAGLTARISRALGQLRDTEVSAGYALRARNVGLLIERRERLDVRSGAFIATAYGGVYDVKLPVGLRFDGFVQGGVAGLRSRRWFADGQARVTKRATLSSRLSVGAGGGAWASAQQGARRVEAGPLIDARIVAGTVGLRIAGEYRFRITGDAFPRSGPALSIGVDF